MTGHYSQICSLSVDETELDQHSFPQASTAEPDDEPTQASPGSPAISSPPSLTINTESTNQQLSAPSPLVPRTLFDLDEPDTSSPPSTPLSTAIADQLSVIRRACKEYPPSSPEISPPPSPVIPSHRSTAPNPHLILSLTYHLSHHLDPHNLLLGTQCCPSNSF